MTQTVLACERCRTAPAEWYDTYSFDVLCAGCCCGEFFGCSHCCEFGAGLASAPETIPPRPTMEVP